MKTKVDKNMQFGTSKTTISNKIAKKVNMKLGKVLMKQKAIIRKGDAVE